MSRPGLNAAAALTLLGLASPLWGCGLGPGESVGDAHLTVTRDFGARAVLERRVGDLRESDTVMRVLDRSAAISTRYGGRFVQSISGVSGGSPGGRVHDWFFFVNGVESEVGAADYPLAGGERIWWDYRDWSASMRVPAVVGSWPQPFSGGYEGHRHPVRVECRGGGEACRLARARIAPVSDTVGSGADPIRVLVGPWSRLRSDPAAASLGRGPQYSGVFARFERRGAAVTLLPIGADGKPRSRLGPGTGLIAATRLGESAPVWLVTGTDRAGVGAASSALDGGDLRNRYAVLTTPAGNRGLPLR